MTNEEHLQALREVLIAEHEDNIAQLTSLR